MYRTSGSCLDTFCENIETILNIDLFKHQEPSGTKHFNDMMYSLCLYPLIDKPTRITESSATLIDYIFTNELRHNLTCGILFNDINDHLPVFALCEYHVNRNVEKEVQHIRMINEDTLASLTNELSLQSREHVLHTNNVNHAYNQFLHIFINMFKFPFKNSFEKP